MSFLKKTSTAFSILLVISLTLCAQDKLPIKFGKVTVEDFDVKSTLIDSSTDAVVVADVGNSEFMANTNDFSFSLLFKQKKRIKILNKNGFDAATVIIPLYVQNNIEEKLQSLDAFTYNLENGKVVSVKVDKASVFSEKRNDHWILKKFTFPAVKEGSIIEFSYQIKSDFFFNLHDWTFQDRYPVLWSQYEAAIPEFYRFVTLSQGYHPFATKKTEQFVKKFTFQEHTTGTDARGLNPTRSSSYENHFLEGNIEYNTWIMKDVPGLKEEPFTTTIQNAIAKIEFQLKQVAYPNTIARNVMNDWQKASEDLMQDERFGALITRPNNWLDDQVADIVKGASSQLGKIQKIYEYVRDNFTCNDYNRYMVTSSLKDVVKNKNGSVADINMLLIAMLRTQGFAADPVLLSTRRHGYVSELYPLMDRYNYLIAHVPSEEVSYFLDASTPRLGFNKLPAKVYNGQARVITKNDAIPVYFLPDSVVDANVTSVFIENRQNGEVVGGVTAGKGYFSSMELRDDIAKDGMEEFKKDIQKDFTEDIEIQNITVDSLKKTDEPVAVKYDIKLNSFGTADIVYFNPMLGEAIRKNPFAAAVRHYPVEMPYLQNDIFTLTMDIPKGYKVDELPQSARIKLNEDEGMFEYLIQADETTIQMRCRLIINRSFFPNEDYQTLRDFFAFVVKKEAEQIVFKKVK